MYIEFPIAYPIAKLLDRLLGEEQGVTYKKAELKTFVGLHRQFGEETLNDDEVTIISSVLELGDKNVADIMTPLEDIYSLPVDTKLSQRVVDQILASGHSRIPIHAQGDTTDFVGMLSESYPYDLKGTGADRTTSPRSRQEGDCGSCHSSFTSRILIHLGFPDSSSRTTRRTRGTPLPRLLQFRLRRWC